VGKGVKEVGGEHGLFSVQIIRFSYIIQLSTYMGLFSRTFFALFGLGLLTPEPLFDS
jgi:hypothetical protein